ncbi:MAG: hypothetical protein WCE87_04290 [Candidatus Udaeobacter sp.]
MAERRAGVVAGKRGINPVPEEVEEKAAGNKPPYLTNILTAAVSVRMQGG